LCSFQLDDVFAVLSNWYFRPSETEFYAKTFCTVPISCLIWSAYFSPPWRFRFTNDANELFDRKDNLSLIRPAPNASKNSCSLSLTPDAKATKGVDTITSFDGDDEENKRE
jgi:hypothetical protein